MIGAHAQNAPNEAVAKKAKSLKMRFPVTKGVRGPDVGLTGIPNIVVFDAKGKLIFAGHPMAGADKVIKKALRGATADAEEEKADGFGLPDRPKNLSEMRDWKNADGKVIQADLVSIEGENAKLKLKNGKTVDYPIAKLSEDDQKFISSKQEESKP